MKRVLSAAVWALLCCLPGFAQISPGPLSHAHQQLEGVTQCSSCHDFGAGRRSFKCLECHTEIQHRLNAHAGFHARAYRSSSGQADCARCHMEHNGQKFALVALDRKAFDHAAQTGFALEGKHRSLACEKCHTESHLPSSVRSQIKEKDLNRTFLGLRRECATCHEDAHRGQEGADCSRCHQQESWQPAPGFNHAQTPFPLAGLHQTVRCEKCHVDRSDEHPAGAARKLALFKGLSYSGCQSCHTDPHHGAFLEVQKQGTCESCHTTSGWKNNHPASEFDHNRTKFKLVGKHAQLDCDRCHKSSDFHRPIAHARCADCHQDQHKGQFASRAAGSDCSSCHNETGFKPALFDREAHRKSAFPLDGKHAGAACTECHKPAGSDTVFILKKLICSDCHADQHAGQFAAAFGNKCDLCHKQDGFQPATFTVERHAQTKFPLKGKHAAAKCEDCHKALPESVAPVAAAMVAHSPASAPRQYHFTAENCKTCHTDPHQTSLACETCHTPEAWKTILAFDHSAAHFKLDGAHQKVACTDCHKGTPAKFAETASQCSSCHAAKDVHGGQFRSAGRDEDCSTCHVATEWSNKTFSHDHARFTLDVAHRNVTCEKCHKEQKDALGKMIRIYRGTPMECVNCH